MSIDRFAVVLSLSVIACSHASRGVGDDDDATTPDSGVTGDADPQACAPAASFTSEHLPGFDAGTWYDGAVLHVGDDGVPHVLVSERSSTGNGAGILEWTRSATTWDRSGIGASASVLEPGAMAATSEDPLCVAYRARDSTLHVACDGAADRTIAPEVDGSLSIARIGGIAGVVYLGQDGALGGLLWQPFDGGAFDGNPGPAELIDGDYASLGTSATAVDAAGDVHVVYEAFAGRARLLYHAVRHAGTWTRESFDEDAPSSDGNTPSNTLSLVIDGDQPAIAYGHHATHSLRLARRIGAGTFDLRTLVTTDAGFPQDRVGRSVGLQRDCAGRLLLVYQRSITTDAHNIGLTYARIGAVGLEDEQHLPQLSNDVTYLHSLGFHVDAAGHQFVSAMVLLGSAPVLYYASR